MVWPQGGKGGRPQGGNQYSNQSGNPRWQPTRNRDDSRDRGSRRNHSRDPTNRHNGSRRRSCSSDSSSREYHRDRKLDRARKLLKKNEPSYDQFLQSEAKAAETKKVKEQGAAMAEALAPALKASLGHSTLSVPSKTQVGTLATIPPSDPKVSKDSENEEPSLGPRIRWLVAELDHEVDLKATTWAGLEKQLKPLLERPKVKQLAYEFLRRFHKVKKGAKTTAQEKSQLIIDILKSN